MYCWSCGHKNPNENKFCGDCGKPQVAPPLIIEQETQATGLNPMAPRPNDVVLTDKPTLVEKRASKPLAHIEKLASVYDKSSFRSSSPELPLQKNTKQITTQKTPELSRPPAPPMQPAIKAPQHPGRRPSDSLVDDLSRPIINPTGTNRVIGSNPPVADSPAVGETFSQPPAAKIPARTVGTIPPSHTRITGPSFLGLSDEGSSGSEYLLEDKSNDSSSLRTYVALALMLVFGVLIYQQWDNVNRAGRSLAHSLGIGTATVAGSTPATTGDSSSPTETASATPPPSPAETKIEKEKQQSNPESDQVAGEASEKTPEKTATADKADASAAEAKPAEAAQLEKSKPSARTQAEPAATPLVYDNSTVDLAQKYLQGRGVPQDCDRGVSLLRSAAAKPNPKAQIQLGALYASGHCVTQDRAEAYRWFAQAKQTQPGNQWIDRNLNTLWSEMSPEERNRAQR